MSEVSIVGYCEPVSCRGGDEVALRLSCDLEGPVTIDVVELICGDEGNPVLGLAEREVEVAGFPLVVDGRRQPIVAGSSATFGPSTLLDVEAFTIGCSVWPSVRPQVPQPVLSLGRATVWWTGDGFTLDPALAGPGQVEHRRWYHLCLSVGDGQGHLVVEAAPTRSPGADATSQRAEAATDFGSGVGGDLLTVGQGFDGRVGSLWMATDAVADVTSATFRWNVSIETDRDRWHDTGVHGLHGLLHQLPTRAVRGPAWDGTAQGPAMAPFDHCDAVHFHTDDLYDAGWETDATLTVPAGLASGVYCFRSRTEGGDIDRTPFFVAADAARRSDVAFLVPVATYLADANQRIHLTNATFAPGGAPTPTSVASCIIKASTSMWSPTSSSTTRAARRSTATGYPSPGVTPSTGRRRCSMSSKPGNGTADASCTSGQRFLLADRLLRRLARGDGGPTGRRRHSGLDRRTGRIPSRLRG